MKNWEKYEDSIRQIGSDFGMMNDGEIGPCGRMACFKCIFTDCNKERINWLYSEYEPPKPKLTREEKTFLDSLHSDTLYIARNYNGRIFLHTCKPLKMEEGECKEWYSSEGVIRLNNVLFTFITYKDDAPWETGKLRRLEVKE